MGSMEAVIGLDLKMCATRAVRGIIGADADACAGNGRLQRLKESVRSLEEERQKIEVFRRELPLCMRILTDVIEGLKREMEQCREEGRNEKFVPAKREFEEEGEAKAEKINWMSSVQLWNNNSSETKEGQENNKEKILEERLPEKGSLFLESKSRGGTGAFVPFKGLKAHGTNVVLTQKEKLTAVPGLPFLSPSIKSAPRPSSTAFQDHQAFPRVVNRTPAPATSSAHLGLQAQHPPSRKARRCWSPELHRRFVLALKQLGGAQAATPKQIRELMKVDGLTNDEVKSHLQKYRLHSQRKPSASATTKLPIIAEAGSWATASENYSSSSGQSLSKSGSPQSPLQLAGCNTTLSSSARDSCEDDGKSESSS